VSQATASNSEDVDLRDLPAGWVAKKVGEIAQVRGGKRLPAGKTLQAARTGRPYVRVSDMHMGGVSLNGILYVPEDACQAIRNYRIYADDVFISVAGTLGIVGRIPPTLNGANLTENADRLTAIQCDVDYLKFWLSSEKIQSLISAIRTVGAQPKLALGRIKQFTVPLPPTRTEQGLISTALRDSDELISSIERLLQKKKSIKQGMLQGLLTGDMRLPGFTDEWRARSLGDLGRTYGGLTGKIGEDFGRGSGRFVTFMDVMANIRIDGRRLAPVEVSPSERQNAVRAGDILLNGSSETPNELAMAAVVTDVPRGTLLNSFCFGFRPNGDAALEPEFLAYLLRAEPGRRLLSATAQGATRYNLSKKQFLRLKVNLPTPAEQTAIAAVLRDVDEEIALLGLRLAKARDIKQGMMQELLTGTTRLVPQGASA
jgi:type I restriction enzyme, S subunit